ncbi:hypothetical protein ACNKHO_10385 [Shigella flexneri]
MHLSASQRFLDAAASLAFQHTANWPGSCGSASEWLSSKRNNPADQIGDIDPLPADTASAP